MHFIIGKMSQKLWQKYIKKNVCVKPLYLPNKIQDGVFKLSQKLVCSLLYYPAVKISIKLSLYI